MNRRTSAALAEKVTTVNSVKQDPCKKPLGANIRTLVLGARSLVWLSLSLLLYEFPALAQSQQSPDAPGTVASAGEQLPDQQLSGRISGTVVDQTGNMVVGARVVLAREGQSPSQEVLSGDDGQFSFANIALGPFHLTITREGFAPQTSSGILRPGEIVAVPQIALVVATVVTEVQVGLSRTSCPRLFAGFSSLSAH